MKKSIYINSLSIFMLFSYSTFFAQKIYIGDGFNEKQILVFKKDSTFEYKNLARSCYDEDAGLIEISGKFQSNSNEIVVIPEKITRSRIKLPNGILNIKSDSLNILKQIISTGNYTQKDKFQSKFNILRYKNFEFLVEDDDFGAEYHSLEDEYLDYTRLIDEDSEYLNYYMLSKMHLISDQNYTKSDLMKSIPDKFKKYFHLNPVFAKVVEFSEKKYRDPYLIPSLPDEEAMLYDYDLTINKGESNGIFPKMKMFAQKDVHNCFRELIVLSTTKNTSKLKLSTDRKCKLKDNQIATSRPK